MNKPLILVVEDDAPVRNLITTTLKAARLPLSDRCKRRIPRMIEASSHNPDIILLDLGTSGYGRHRRHPARSAPGP